MVKITLKGGERCWKKTNCCFCFFDHTGRGSKPQPRAWETEWWQRTAHCCVERSTPFFCFQFTEPGVCRKSRFFFSAHTKLTASGLWVCWIKIASSPFKYWRILEEICRSIYRTHHLGKQKIITGSILKWITENCRSTSKGYFQRHVIVICTWMT